MVFIKRKYNLYIFDLNNFNRIFLLIFCFCKMWDLTSRSVKEKILTEADELLKRMKGFCGEYQKYSV